MSAIARIAVSPRLSLAALRSIRPATVQVQLSYTWKTVSNPSEELKSPSPLLLIDYDLSSQASSLLSTSAPKSDIDSAAKFIGAGGKVLYHQWPGLACFLLKCF